MPLIIIWPEISNNDPFVTFLRKIVNVINMWNRTLNVKMQVDYKVSSGNDFPNF